MNYILAVFKSRYATLKFSNLLKANRIPVAIINTPQGLNRACGISVKFLKEYHSLAIKLLLRNNMQAEGFYEIIRLNGRIVFEKI